MGRTVVRRATVLGSVLVLALTGLVAGTALDASAKGFQPGPVGSDEFKGGEIYRGDFPDPSILRVGTTYYAYSTTIANKNLPVMTSRDMVTWRAHAPWKAGEWWNNDGLNKSASWAEYKTIGTRRVSPTWAPSVAKVGTRYVHAYATPVRGTSPRKFCVSVSTSAHPGGPFVDRTSRPLVCPSNQGAIDPQVWVSPGGRRFLLWKNEGRPGVESTKIWSQRLTTAGTALLPGSSPNLLLETAQPWEGSVIENPAIIFYAGRYYLFYSANSWSSDRYAVGYAVCRAASGPCERPTTVPLLKTTGTVAGPGGETPFVGPNGELRLGYHAWTTGNVGYPPNTTCKSSSAGCAQRRLHVATLGVNPDDGTLSVTKQG